MIDYIQVNYQPGTRSHLGMDIIGIILYHPRPNDSTGFTMASILQLQIQV
jgi:hypothetical protein